MDESPEGLETLHIAYLEKRKGQWLIILTFPHFEDTAVAKNLEGALTAVREVRQPCLGIQAGPDKDFNKEKSR